MTQRFDHSFFDSEKALQFTNDASVEAAMEWLLAHSDANEVPPTDAGASTVTPADAAAAAPSESAENQTSESESQAKSLKCDEW